MKHELTIKNLHVSVDNTPILKGVSLTIRPGELHALMGPNGSGKSTLALVLMGHPRYQITKGEILLDGEDIRTWTPEQRAQAGLFLSQQHPPEIPGVTFGQFLRTAYHAIHKPTKPVPFLEFSKRLTDAAAAVNLPETVLERGINEGFSGGEKKRAEILQLRVLEPSIVVLDEPDSGLDLDAIKTVSQAIAGVRTPERSFLIVTHNPAILPYLKPDAVHVFGNGKILRSGDASVAEELARSGFVPDLDEARVKAKA